MIKLSLKTSLCKRFCLFYVFYSSKLQYTTPLTANRMCSFSAIRNSISLGPPCGRYRRYAREEAFKFSQFATLISLSGNSGKTKSWLKSFLCHLYNFSIAKIHSLNTSFHNELWFRNQSSRYKLFSNQKNK